TAHGGHAWVESAIESIEASAAKKPDDRYFIAPHGHFRTINGFDLARANMDDGKTSELSAIRQMMLYNYDGDWTGGHNNPVLEFLPYLAALELSVGILKVPSF
ncbi:MAG TPA: hypothetical protein PLO51_03600, partial [Candidatus Micrarchaeota archaeon]|nr:hypothetical protein [Candidatus Micrarchaeota archaeon]